MKIRVRELALPLDYSENDLRQAAARRLDININHILSVNLVRKAVDARRSTVHFSFTLDLELPDTLKLSAELLSSPQISLLPARETVVLTGGQQPLPLSPLVVGAGPAGLFCALLLARQGYRPILLERGLDLDRRVQEVEQFWNLGLLHPQANAQFGEGGAGTFSDGKLTTRIGDPRVQSVLETFVEHGAPEEILYLKKPHVGTDMIRQVVKNMRKEIIARGGQVYFQARLSDLSVHHRSITSIIINETVEVPCSILVLAVGNSARDVFRLLDDRGVQLAPKGFAVGARIEHPQEWVDRVQYGDYAGHPRLGAADYHLTFQDRISGRSLYTFCMCPGGYVIAASSEAGQVVTNGMSYFNRDSGQANSALVVTVSPADWHNTPLGGMELQESLERKAYELGGGGYRAPAQMVKDFLQKHRSDSLEGSLATYKPGVNPANLWELFPLELCQVLERGLKTWERRMKGFAGEQAVLTGVETRTSSPLRILRGEELHSLTFDNLYPCGEGSGYAGGIVSSAVDGLRVAEKIISIYNKPDETIELGAGMESAKNLS
ncbi:MAG TPA: NAD(P)-binding protein [Syntrophomonadaceae bacterium]|nr:NAD(P)-binding protein [Syntrophomonadaceae bacterium]